MNAPEQTEEFHPDQTNGQLARLINALNPTGLLYKRKELDSLDADQRKGLLFDVYGPGDLELRCANLYLVLPLLHRARSQNEKEFLLKIFVPWVGLRRKLEVNRSRILDEFAKTQSFPPGSSQEAAHQVNVYRNIVADLIDPYLTLIVACYQFVEGTFVNLESANFGLGERNKDEYLTARIKKEDPEIHLLSGYSALVRNAVSHSGSHGVEYKPGKILFRNIKRGPSPTVETTEWTIDQLLENVTLLYECILSIDAAVGIFGLDIAELLENDWVLYSQAIYYATSPEEQDKMQAAADARLDAIRTNESMPFGEKYKALWAALEHNYALRRMPVKGTKYRNSDAVLRIEVPVTQLDATNEQQILNGVARLSRYAILAESAFGQLAEIYVTAEIEDDGKEQIVAGFKREALHEYNDKRAGLYDLLDEATVRVNGMRVSLSVDFDAVSRDERESLRESFPRRDCSNR
jgi:hypothetical protein